MSEASLHRAVSDFLRWAVSPCVWWTTFPLGGGGMVRGAQIKAAGARNGTPDMLFVHLGRAYWIELKTKTGRVSPAQQECHAGLKQAGAEVAICRSIEDVEAALLRWSIPLRAVTNGGKS